MANKLTIMDTRKMTKGEIEEELSVCARVLEDCGMSHETACDFISGVMNLGIALQELMGRNKTTKN